MSEQAISLAAANTIWSCWQNGQVLDALPREQRPSDLPAGFAIQALLPQASGRSIVGWKLAATNPSGQAHIGVDGPLPGRLLSGQVLADGATINLTGNRMRVAEAEFGLRLASDLPPQAAPYTEADVGLALASVHACIEVPDSRFADFAAAGAAQLAADCACAQWFVCGPPASGQWREYDLSAHQAVMRVNGEVAVEGCGADVLGGPLTALAWLANAGHITGGLAAGQIITTGVCGHPQPIKPGDEVTVDLGPLGEVSARLTS
jgi:2-keto-4-pentenoate hydratase